MKVLLLPSSTNPYQRELTSALGRLGVTAKVGGPRRFLPVLLAVLQDGRPDIFHLHWMEPLALRNNPVTTSIKGLRLIAELLVLRLAGVRIVWTVHNLADHDGRHPRLQLLINKSIARLSNRLIVHSQAAKAIVERALHRPGGQLAVVPHASFAETYENNISQQDARLKLGLPPHSLVFLHFGVLREYKGTRHLIETFRSLPLPTARLLIAGQPADTELAASIQTAASQDERIVAHLTLIPEEDVQLFVNASDAVVIPYTQSLTSGVALLAMGFGKPVIAPRTAVMKEVLDLEANLLYDENDDTGLASALEAAERSQLMSMGQQNLTRAIGLSWQEMATQTKDVYDSVMAGRRVKPPKAGDERPRQPSPP